MRNHLCFQPISSASVGRPDERRLFYSCSDLAFVSNVELLSGIIITYSRPGALKHLHYYYRDSCDANAATLYPSDATKVT